MKIITKITDKEKRVCANRLKEKITYSHCSTSKLTLEDIKKITKDISWYR